MDSIVGAIGCSGITGLIHDGNISTGGTPELENTKVIDGNVSQMSRALLLDRTAIAITAIEKMTTTSTGTSMKGMTASQPPSNRLRRPAHNGPLAALDGRRGTEH